MQHFATIPFLLLFATIASAAEPVKVFNRWDGKVLDEKLKKLAPEDNIISDQKTLETVWKAWRDDEVPKIDFSQSLMGATAHARRFASSACGLMADDFGWGLEKERPPLAGM